MKTVLITGDENAVPAEYLNQIRATGIELACRKCKSPEEVEAFEQAVRAVRNHIPRRKDA